MTSGEVIGRVVSLHRYPVKSMGGESLERVEITERGLAGDRAFALVDPETGRVVSAKRPRRWPGILEHRATLVADGHAASPGVRIRLADGATVTSADVDELERRVAEALGRPVRLASSVPDGASFEYHWPDMEIEYKGRTYRDEITRHDTLEGTFFDGARLHLLTTASLEHLRGLAPGSDFAAARFRPNVLIELTDGSIGLVENDWVGRTIAIGDTVRLETTEPCFRCVMVTLPQGALAKDPGVLRAAVQHNEGNVGVKATPSVTGRVVVGDPVKLV